MRAGRRRLRQRAAVRARRAAARARLRGAHGARRGHRAAAVRRARGEAGGPVGDRHDRRRLGRHARAWSPTCCPTCSPAPARRSSTPAGRWGCCAPSPALAEEHGAWSQCAVEESMACGIGVCMTCVLPVRGDDGVARMVRSCVEGPVFRGDRVLWDDVGTVPAGTLGAPQATERTDDRHRARRPASSPRCTSTSPSTLAGVAPADPVMTASGCAAAGRELEQFFDVAELGAVVTKSIMLDPRSGRADPADGRDPVGDAQLDRPAGARDRRLPRPRPALAAAAAAPAPSCRSPAGRWGSTPSSARRVGNSPGVAAIEVNISCPNVENRGLVFACDPFQAARAMSAVRRGTPRGRAGARQALARRHRHRRHRRGGDGGRRRRAHDDQHPARPGDRPRHPCGRCSAASPAACPGRPSGRSRCAASGRCTRRCPTCRSSAWAASAPGGRAGVHAGRRERGPGRHRDLQRPVARRTGSPASCAASWPPAASPRPADVVGFAHRPLDRPRRTPMTHAEHRSAQRLRAAMDARGPLCVGIDPHAGLLARLGPARRRRRARAVRDDRASRRWRVEVAVLKPQSAFFERHGSRGHRRAGAHDRRRPRGRCAGAARRQARRHRLDRCRATPTPTSTRPRRWRSTR